MLLVLSDFEGAKVNLLFETNKGSGKLFALHAYSATTSTTPGQKDRFVFCVYCFGFEVLGLSIVNA
jgi:hypothetical protein